jgi:DNA mismatch repair protein MutL
VSRIAILSSSVADQIAAGEVVERPHSVVKELIENALDAGAHDIGIHVEDGGRSLIQVSDDGCGMSGTEALLSLQRHATSKIRSTADIVGVQTFGFRGEALPSIASVSQLELETAVSDGAGVRVIPGGALEATTRRRGTTVSIRALFHNVPARRKFLRSARSEWRAIQDAIVLLALTRLDVRFHVEHDGRRSLELPGVSGMRERVAQLWGAAFAERLLDIDDVSGPSHTSGLAERPADVGTSSRRAHTLINGRAVRDHGLLRAAQAAYRSTVPAGARPSVFLSVVVPGDSVDINVHPAKAEVRFRERWMVERSVERAVQRALGTLNSGALFSGYRGGWTGAPAVHSGWTAAAVLPAPGSQMGALEAARDSGSGFAPSYEGSDPDSASAIATRQESDLEEITVPHLLQLRRTYLFFERDDGVVLIDQHAAHERVLYERFLATLDGGAAAGQRLLFPLTLHLDPSEAEVFEVHREHLERLGFEVEGFGGNTVLVCAVPMPHPRFDAEHCLRDTITALTGDRNPSHGARHERLAATVACKAAIKAGDQMSQPEMRALYIDLASTRLPAHDVHGRAVVVHLTWEEVERRFGRR